MKIRQINKSTGPVRFNSGEWGCSARPLPSRSQNKPALQTALPLRTAYIPRVSACQARCRPPPSLPR